MHDTRRRDGSAVDNQFGELRPVPELPAQARAIACRHRGRPRIDRQRPANRCITVVTLEYQRTRLHGGASGIRATAGKRQATAAGFDQVQIASQRAAKGGGGVLVDSQGDRAARGGVRDRPSPRERRHRLVVTVKV